MSDTKTLYQRLGGDDAISAVVDRFYERVLFDESLEHYFQETDMESLRAHQTQFFVAVTGGPAEYSGAEMQAAHAHLGITAEEFGAVAGHLRATLEEFDVADDDVEEVMATVGELEDDIVAD